MASLTGRRRREYARDDAAYQSRLERFSGTSRDDFRYDRLDCCCRCSGRLLTKVGRIPFLQPAFLSSHLHISITMAALINILGAHAKRQAGGLDYNSAPPNLSTLANNTIFDTWRPKAHVLPPSNHIGDPCSELLPEFFDLEVSYLLFSSALHRPQNWNFPRWIPVLFG